MKEIIIRLVVFIILWGIVFFIISMVQAKKKLKLEERLKAEICKLYNLDSIFEVYDFLIYVLYVSTFQTNYINANKFIPKVGSNENKDMMRHLSWLINVMDIYEYANWKLNKNNINEQSCSNS
jgi:hypothetical protein